MIVISDTSPINYLVLIGHIDLLPALFSRVFVPPAVLNELRRQETPSAVMGWLASKPEWLEVRAPVRVDRSLDLGAGEREAISLASELPDTQVLVDDRRARNVARAKGIRVSGTLGVLELAAQEGLVDLPSAIARLRDTSFRASERLLRAMLARHGESQ